MDEKTFDGRVHTILYLLSCEDPKYPGVNFYVRLMEDIHVSEDAEQAMTDAIHQFIRNYEQDRGRAYIGTPRLFRYDSPESRQIFVSELRARSLPSSRLSLLDSFASVEWIAICNPILTDAILNMQIWSVVTNQDDIPEAGFKAGRSLPASLSREQLFIVGIALAAGIAAWLLLRRKI